MLSGRETISHYSSENVKIWMIMAFQAGALNIGGLMACHTFVSHVTGFATLVGLELVETHKWGNVLKLISIPMFFLIGSAFSGIFVDLKIHTGRKPQYYYAFGAIFFTILLVLIGSELKLFGTFGKPLHLVRDYAFVGLLCLACGLQNGVVTSVSKSVIRTTHLTGITTDLGIGIVRAIYRKKYPEKWPEERKANLMRAGLICFFILGSSIGAYGFLHFTYFGFLLPLSTAGYLFVTSLNSQLLYRKVNN